MPSWYNIQGIYVWNQQVRPKWWKPWSHTIAYYPLHENTDEVMGNYSWTWGSATFGDNMATVTSRLYRSWTFFHGYTGDFTISAYVKMTTSPSYWGIMFKSDSGYNASLEISSYYAWTNNGANKWAWVSYYNSWWYYKSSVGTNGGIYNVIWVKSSWTMYVYVNWSQIWTFTAWNYPWSWWSSWDTANIPTWVICADVIIENIAWTADEVSEYYNQTKWTYWL